MSDPKSHPSRRIVSSRHLAEGEGWEASELEYGMIIAYNAFSRWMSRCMAAAGNADLTPLEILREIAAQLRAISGQYDQASRAAASL